MIIGIDASAAFRKERTGVEEYVFQLLKYFSQLPEAKEHTFWVYMDPRTYMEHPLPVFFTGRPEHEKAFKDIFGFEAPGNFKLVPLYIPLAWRQVRLAIHFLFKKPDVLFMPTQLLPLFSPKRSVITVHGLEYEHYPQFYSGVFTRYIRSFTKCSSKRSGRIIAPSESTKNDLVRFYGVDRSKIGVVFHGAEQIQRPEKCDIPYSYILFVGRVETKKNVQGLIELFEALKKDHNIPHKLVLAGYFGYGAKVIKEKISKSPFKDDIILKGYVPPQEKGRHIACADLLALVSFYEGFGLPVIEAQKSGVPVVCSDVSSLSEIAGLEAVKVDPKNILASKEEVYKALMDKNKREKMTAAGYENAKRFDWEKCAKETFKIIIGA